MSQRMIHPGPRAADRAVAVAASLRPIAGVLPAGRVLMTAVGRLFADAGCTDLLIAYPVWWDADRADRAGFGRDEEAAIEAADHEQEQQQDRKSVV